MSLRFIHIFFISASIALSVFFGVWANANKQTGAWVMPVGILSLATGCVLAFYLADFIRKTKRLGK